jgi:hypothetical protein
MKGVGIVAVVVAILIGLSIITPEGSGELALPPTPTARPAPTATPAPMPVPTEHPCVRIDYESRYSEYLDRDHCYDDYLRQEVYESGREAWQNRHKDQEEPDYKDHGSCRPLLDSCE